MDLTSLELKNSLNIDTDTLGYLFESLQEFSNLDDELPVRLLRYLVDGEDEAAVAEMVNALEQQMDPSERAYHLRLMQAISVDDPQNAWSMKLDHSLYRSGPDSQALLTFLSQSSSISDPKFYYRLSCVWCSCRYVDNNLSVVNSSALSQQSFRDHLLRFLTIVLHHHHQISEPIPQTNLVSTVVLPYQISEPIPQTNLALTARIVDGMYVESGEAAGSFIRDIYDVAPDDYYQIELANFGPLLKDFPHFTLEHSGVVKAALQHPQRERRIHAMTMLLQGKVLIDEFVDAIATSAVSSAKSERDIAAKLLQYSPKVAAPALQSRAESGNSSERQQAIKLLWELTGETSKSFLLQRLEIDKAAKVKSTIEQLIAAPKVEPVANAMALPPLQPVNFDTPLPDAALKSLETLKEQVPPNQADLVNETTNQIVALLQCSTYKECLHHYRDVHSYVSRLLILLEMPDIQLIHVVRLLVLSGQINNRQTGYNRELISHAGHQLLSLYQKQHPGCVNLRQLAAVLKVLEIDPERISDEMLAPWSRYSQFWHWGDDAIWPYFAERLTLFEEVLFTNVEAGWEASYLHQERRKNIFRVLKLFPQIPAELVPILWRLAFEGPKSERPIAQTYLNTLSDTSERIIQALSDTNRDIRTVAAIWLCDRNDPAAITPLKKALKKEKSEATKDVMLRSLEKLGASVDEFFDRDNLLKESQKLLKKGIPAALDWFPFEAMPPVHWQDTVKPVATDLIKGLIVKCFKQKTAEPGPIFRRYIELWRPTDQREFGQFVLNVWIAQDIAPAHTPEEADALAQEQAKQTYQYFQKILKNDPSLGRYYGATYEELYQQHYNQLCNECIGSAIKEKGVLAFASACCSAEAVAPIQTYLKTWYGKRAAQCKALLQILGWIDDNSAIQLLLSVANRFRTKSIQKEAEKLVNELAERRGWSRDELADRTIPTAGFEQGAEQTLDYGERQFTVLLETNMNLVLKNADGKVIKALPAPRKDEDADQVKAAKKQLSDTKKQLKQVLKMQRERLYEAMCTQRSWQFADWDLYLNQHPIVGRYCQQLVWAICDGDTVVQTFRPLDDRTLTDAEDDAVTPEPSAMVRLAHSSAVSAEAMAAWQTHFADYEVVPLLQQFRNSHYLLPDEKQNDTELGEFEGYLVEAFQLRGTATKQGYTRGQTEDGGCFYDYRKPFAGLGMEAVINFSGNYLPEENHTVALTKLVFERLPDADAPTNYYNRPKLPLKDVPVVLLSEVWHDLQTVASQGSGYDPAWEKKVWK